MKHLVPIEWRSVPSSAFPPVRERDRRDGSVSPTGGRRPEHGITIVELMVVLAIMALMMGLGGYALNSATDGDLRADAGAVTAAIKYTYANAAINNTEYRLVFNLDSGTYRSEVAKSAIVEVASTASDSEEFLTEEAQRLGDKVDEERDLFSDEEENPFGMNRKVTFERVEDGVLKKTKLKSGNRFARFLKGSSDEEYTEGEVSMSFFPNGFQEQVMIVLEGDAGASYTLVTEPLTGRILTYTDSDDVPDGFGEVEEDE